MAWVSCTFEGSGIYGQSTNSLIIKLSKIPGKYTYPAEVKEDADEEEEGAEDAPRTVYEGEWLNGQKVSEIAQTQHA